MNRIKKRMLTILDGAASHYTCNNRSTKNSGNTCVYVPPSPEISEGCAIGRLLPKWAKKELLRLKLNSGGVDSLFDGLSRIPRVFKGIDIDFLTDLQNIHDDCGCWDKHGLTDDGKNKVRRLKHEHQLV